MHEHQHAGNFSFIMLLFEVLSALVVIMLGIALVGGGLRYMVTGHAGPLTIAPSPAPSTTRRDSIEVSTQTAPYFVYPSSVFVSRAGDRYHLDDRCGGLSGHAAAPKTLCGTCASRVHV